MMLLLMMRTMLPSRQEMPVWQFSTAASVTLHVFVDPRNKIPLPEQLLTLQDLTTASPPHNLIPSVQCNADIDDAMQELSGSLRTKARVMGR
jgi:hypothetical protein